MPRLKLGMERGPFYLTIAGNALKRLEQLTEPMDGGAWKPPAPRGYKITSGPPSPHFETAIISYQSVTAAAFCPMISPRCH